MFIPPSCPCSTFPFLLPSSPPVTNPYPSTARTSATSTLYASPAEFLLSSHMLPSIARSLLKGLSKPAGAGMLRRKAECSADPCFQRCARGGSGLPGSGLPIKLYFFGLAPCPERTMPTHSFTLLHASNATVNETEIDVLVGTTPPTPHPTPNLQYRPSGRISNYLTGSVTSNQEPS